MALMKLSPLTLSTAHQKLSCFGEPQMPRSLRSPPIKLSIRASISKVCVYCGSNSGTRQVYTDAALDLGAQLVEKKVGLVYGGGNIGLMGLVSQTVYDGGCHVLGIIPGALIPVEVKKMCIFVYLSNDEDPPMIRNRFCFSDKRGDLKTYGGGIVDSIGYA
ncbi:hypothetical protein LWI29_008510 [Acer saccharum]|uniref:Cytokinin riboside 5'-monophosphate phosphoribohydrolase n=1 Tax=Acer saccharum TaxID=4024 RepID=A0AA39W5S6_ACESA|nr:hypothetical protein LWI29_008510 [Acer saccharum]